MGSLLKNGAAKDASAVSDVPEESQQSADVSAPSEKTRRRLQSAFAHGAQDAAVPHRLEVRIRNVERPERFVVAKCAQQLRGPEEQSCRQTMIFDAAVAKQYKRYCSDNESGGTAPFSTLF